MPTESEAHSQLVFRRRYPLRLEESIQDTSGSGSHLERESLYMSESPSLGRRQIRRIGHCRAGPTLMASSIGGATKPVQNRPDDQTYCPGQTDPSPDRMPQSSRSASDRPRQRSTLGLNDQGITELEAKLLEDSGGLGESPTLSGGIPASTLDAPGPVPEVVGHVEKVLRTGFLQNGSVLLGVSHSPSTNGEGKRWNVRPRDRHRGKLGRRASVRHERAACDRFSCVP